MNHTIEKTVAKRVAGKVGVSVKARQFPCRKLKGDYFLLTGPLMGDPDASAGLSADNPARAGIDRTRSHSSNLLT